MQIMSHGHGSTAIAEMLDFFIIEMLLDLAPEATQRGVGAKDDGIDPAEGMVALGFTPPIGLLQGVAHLLGKSLELLEAFQSLTAVLHFRLVAHLPALVPDCCESVQSD